jgi:hypothetical protein
MLTTIKLHSEGVSEAFSVLEKDLSSVGLAVESSEYHKVFQNDHGCQSLCSCKRVSNFELSEYPPSSVDLPAKQSQRSVQDYLFVR